MPSRILIEETPLVGLRDRHGGRLVFGAEARHVRGLSSIHDPREGTLVPVTRAELVPRVDAALASGAQVIVSEALAPRLGERLAWVHPEPASVVATLLAGATAEDVAGPPGDGCVIHPTAIVHPRVRLGRRVHVGAYAVLGAPGFGFVARGEGLEHVPQLGGVVVGDDVWIASHVTIDAGTLGPTHVGAGTKIDSHVHVGHNVRIGRSCVLCAQVGLAGSVELGDGVVLGGQVGVADHVRVGAFAKVAAKSGVTAHVPEGAVVAGYPAVPRVTWLRGLAASYRAATGHTSRSRSRT
jgi:UDP-3-O-[3-hydroxymyristoyl] glucosamine N-acyltransferase